jgi:ABC-type glycerol-3-phosphate transport system substrate-binding protein
MLAGPIDTWEKLAAIVPYLRVTNGDSISTAAVAMGTSLNVERSYDIVQTIMMQNGTQLTSEDLNSATFNQNQIGSTAPKYPGEDALKFYLRFSNPSDALYTWNDKMPNSYDAFKNGQLALMFHYASTYRFLKEQAPNLKNSIEVIPMPQVQDPKLVSDKSALKTMANMWVETVPSAKADAKKQRAAWAFIQYITSKSGSRPYLSAMKLPSALKEGNSSVKFQAFNDQKSYADAWYKGTRAENVDELFIGSIDDVYKGRRTPKATLDELSTQVTTVLQASNAKWATVAKQ